MTIDEFLQEAILGLDLSDEVAKKVQQDLRGTLTDQMKTGMTEEEAVASLVDPEEEVARLILKYDEEVQTRQTGEGKLPMMFWWGLMLSAVLAVVKTLQWMLVERSAFNVFGICVGAAGLVACGIYTLVWKKKHPRTR